MSLSIASSSNLRITSQRIIRHSTQRLASTYTPYQPTDLETPQRPPRPTSSVFFTGRPQQSSEFETLETLLFTTQQSLRSSHLYPLPESLQLPQPPQIRWKSPSAMSTFFGRELKSNTHRKVLDILNELNKLRYIAEFGERGDIADKVKARLDKYLRQDENSGWEVETKKVVTDIDSFGRTSGVGKRKEASAKVWIIPTKSASQILDVQSPSTPESESQTPAIPVPGEILVNHLPISKHFTRPLDREIILRPLRLAGLLGAYNVFAKVKGGGSSGQAGAVALGLSRALLAMRGEEVKDTLMAADALRRDPRMTERKKTNLLKARKARTWVKR